jgi:hypothetical protein
MKFIVAGVGFWGKKWVELLDTYPRASVVATVDMIEAAAAWSQQMHGIPGFFRSRDGLGKNRCGRSASGH